MPRTSGRIQTSEQGRELARRRWRKEAQKERQQEVLAELEEAAEQEYQDVEAKHRARVPWAKDGIDVSQRMDDIRLRHLRQQSQAEPPKQLTEAHLERLQALQAVPRDLIAKAKYAKDFADCSPGQQQTILEGEAKTEQTIREVEQALGRNRETPDSSLEAAFRKEAV